MTTTAIEQEILDLERAYWQAIRDRDVAAAVALTDFPCVIAGARGAASVTREQYEGMMRDPGHLLHAFRIGDDAIVRALGDDAAVIAYRVRLDSTMGGQRAAREAADLSTWVRRDGRWRCAAHADAAIGGG